MFLYPALLAGFAFVAVPPLVHLINMLRHRRRRWAAMDFLLASYRRQRKWLRLRQLLLLLARLGIATVLIAMLCGWTGGRQMLGILGGQTTHHVVILDDSYSMGDVSGGEVSAYDRGLQSVEQLVRRLAASDGEHQLTVMRASRAALAIRGGSESGDAVADLSAQTIVGDNRLISRVMATDASSVLTDLVPALDLAGEMVTATEADRRYVYVVSDFRSRDWESTERLAESMRALSGDDIDLRMIDCATAPDRNLAVTDLSPVQDVWVAGVPVVVRATIKNYGLNPVKNLTLACRVIRYGDQVDSVDPSRRVSGNVDALPGLVIESLEPGAEITKSFQVFVSETGTHAVEVELPSDALAVDNVRSCTLPLSDVERVLVVDSDPDEADAYTIAAVLDPGSQVRIGALPEIQPPSFLRSVTVEQLTPYRAVYLVDLPELTETAAASLEQYVRRGGGVAWFLGENVQPARYNQRLLTEERRLLPAPLGQVTELETDPSSRTGNLVLGDEGTLMDPLRSAGDAALARVRVSKSWSLEDDQDRQAGSKTSSADDDGSGESGQEAEKAESGSREALFSTRQRVVLKRRDGQPVVTEHLRGAGTVVTVLTDLDSRWTNWPGDPTFVPFMLLSNARLWSGASPRTERAVTDPLVQTFSEQEYFPELKLVAPANAPPRVVADLMAEPAAEPTAEPAAGPTAEPAAEPAAGQTRGADESPVRLELDPVEALIAGRDNVEELLRPGLFEWGLLRADGGGEVVPVATAIEVGEGDLQRAEAAEIRQGLLPIEVRFISSQDWNQENQFAGSSRLGLILLALLALLLAAEQALAYWASYHASGPATGAAGTGVSGAGHAAAGGAQFGLAATSHAGGQSG